MSHVEQRILEAEKLGFSKIFVSTLSLKGINRSQYKIELIGVRKIDDLLHELFG